MKNTTLVSNIKVPVPTLVEQQKFVTKIEALAQKIAEAQVVIDAAPPGNRQSWKVTSK